MTDAQSRKRRSRQTGSLKQVALWVSVAAVAGVLFASKIYDSGASDLSFIIAMSVAGVVAIAIVAPRKFSSIRNLIGVVEPSYAGDAQDSPPSSAGASGTEQSAKSGKDAA